MLEKQETIIRLLDALYPGVKIYLFGSRARGTHHPAADIDLAIDTGAQLPFGDLAIPRAVLEGLYLSYKIDIVDFHSIPEYLRQTILKEGIVWKK